MLRLNAPIAENSRRNYTHRLHPFAAYAPTFDLSWWYFPWRWWQQHWWWQSSFLVTCCCLSWAMARDKSSLVAYVRDTRSARTWSIIWLLLTMPMLHGRSDSDIACILKFANLSNVITSCCHSIVLTYYSIDTDDGGDDDVNGELLLDMVPLP